MCDARPCRRRRRPYTPPDRRAPIRRLNAFRPRAGQSTTPNPPNRRQSSLLQVRLAQREQIRHERTCLLPRDNDVPRGRDEARWHGHDDISRRRRRLLLEIPGEARHDGLRDDDAGVVEMKQVPRVARLARRHIGEVGTRAFRTGEGRVLSRVVFGHGRPAIGPVERQVTDQLGVAEAAPFLQVDCTTLLGERAPGRDTRYAARVLNAHRWNDRDQDCEREVANECEPDDRTMAGVKVHADASTAGAAGVAASARPGRMAQTLTAKTRWLATINTPPAVRHSHIGWAASTERMKASPATQAKPWRMPAIESDTT